MKRTLLLLIICLSFSFVCNTQTVRKTTTPEVKTPAPPSANGKFKFYYLNGIKGFFNDIDGRIMLLLQLRANLQVISSHLL